MTEGVFRHKDTKFLYARVLLHPTPSGHKRAAPSVSFADVSPSYGEQPSRREPSFDLCARPMCILKIYFDQNYCQMLNICKPSPVGEGVKRSLTDEEPKNLMKIFAPQKSTSIPNSAFLIKNNGVRTKMSVLRFFIKPYFRA